MKPKNNPLLRASRLALAAITFGALPAIAGTVWDGEGGATADINLADNWDGTAPGVVNALNGTTAASFATGGSLATMNANGYFTALTFNRNDAAGFTVNGPQTLSVKNSASGGTVNFTVSDTDGNGVTTINAPFQINTSTGTTRLLTATNLEAGTATPSLLFTNTISASTPANTYGFRFGGAGTTKISGAISNTTGIQQTYLSGAGQLSGTVIIAGNQALGSSSTVNIAATSSGVVASTARIQMGETTADLQSWGSTTVNQAGTVAVNSTATLSGAVALCTTGSSGVSGGTLEVNGSLSATTLGIGSSLYSGTLKVSGTASFSGALTTGSLAGSKIVGNAATNGTLKLSSGTNLNTGVSTVIGGADTNENNLNLEKINSGMLTLTGTNTYTGTTTVTAGTLNLGGTLASPITVKAGATLTGEGSTTGSLTFATGNTTLQFDPGGTPTVALTADTVDVSAAGLVYVSPTAATTPSSTYTVLKQVKESVSFSDGDLAKFALATRGGTLSITGAGKEITMTATAVTPVTLTWKGNDVTNPTFWDVVTTQNWDKSGSADRFYTGDAVTFNDTGSTTVAVQGTSVAPGNILFDNTTAYTLSGGGIGGSGSLTKSNTGTVTLANSLANTGGVTVNAGVLSLGTTNTNTFTGGIDLNGGELQFGGASILGSLNTQAVSLDGGAITFKGAATIVNDVQTFNVTTNGGSINVDTPNNITWRIGGPISGSGNWSKSGTGVLALGKNGTGTAPISPVTGSNFDGTITVTAGNLDVRNTDSLGTTVGGTSVSNAVLEIFAYGQNQGITITGEPLSLSGTSYFRSKNEDLDSDVTNEWTGPVTVAASAVVGLGSPKYSTSTNVSKFILSGAVSTGASSVLNLGQHSATVPTTIQEIDITGTISGSGSVTAQGATGSVYTLNDPEYAGNTTVNSGKLSLGADNSANNDSTVSIAATGATLDLNFDESGGPVTDTVDKLFIGGTQKNAGVYKASDNLTDSGTGITQITGPGTLTVTSNPSGYSAWQTANAPDQTVAQDHDNDGVDNGIEYFMGQSGSGFTATPVLDSSNHITWTMGDDYIGVYDTDYVIQTSSDLTTWSPVAVGDVTIDVNLPGKSVSYTLTGSGARFVRLLVNPN